MHGAGAGTEMTLPHLTTIAFAPGQSPTNSQIGAITTSGSDNGGDGILTYIRSVAHTIHHDDPGLQFQPEGDSDYRSPEPTIPRSYEVAHTRSRSRSKSFSDREARYAPPGLGLVYGKAKDREAEDAWREGSDAFSLSSHGMDVYLCLGDGKDFGWSSLPLTFSLFKISQSGVLLLFADAIIACIKISPSVNWALIS